MTLVYLAVAWVVGIALARVVPLPWQVLLLVALAGLVGLVGWEGSRRTRLFCLCAVTLTLGAARLQLALPRFDERSLANHNDHGPATLEGVVVAEPDVRETVAYLRLRAERLTFPDGRTLDVEGLALVRVSRYPSFAYGDRLRVTGPLATPPEGEDFSYRDYLARQGIHSLIENGRAVRVGSGEGNPLVAALLAFKRRAQTTIAAILHEPSASLLTGILLGNDNGIPADLMDDFSATGTSHIIAISGFNISIIAGIFAAVARRLAGPRRAAPIAIGGVVLYTILVGASAAVVRAAIMGSLYLLGRHLRRATFAPTSLAAAALLMTALDPFTLWDMGFQLSFAATVGLMLYATPLQRGAVALLSRLIPPERAARAVGWVSESLLVTLAAQITTIPLILYAFHRLSLVTLLTNLLILPVQPAVMICGGVATLAGLAWLPAGRVLGWLAWLPLTYTIEAVRLTARVPYAWLDLGRMDAWMLWAFYALLGALTWWGYQSHERRAELLGRARAAWSALSARLSDRLLLTASAVALLLAVAAWRSLPDGRLHVTFLDVGQGDAVFIQTPSGRQALIDGGPSPSRLLTHLGRRLPFWDHTLDLVVLSHPDDDLLAGLIPVLERYRVDAVLARDVGCRTPLYIRWNEVVASSGATLWQGETGLQIWLDEGLRLTVLYPGAELSDSADFNVHSLVLRLDYGQTCFLFPGDVDAEVEEQLLEEGAWLDCTVLQAAHHGDSGSTSDLFLEAVTPQMVVIPVGAGNLYHYPHAETLRRLDGLPVYRTDENGSVQMVSDGKRVWVETER